MLGRRQLILGVGLAALARPVAALGGGYTVRRLVDRPIIAPGMDARMGANIEGPSLIATPDWLPARLGRYYLYFADHKGDYIRLAYADRLEGPWKVHSSGSLSFSQSKLPARLSGSPQAEARLRALAAQRDPAEYAAIPTPLEDASLPHIASPDVHVDAARRRIVMYYHGLAEFGVQRTRAAMSHDGVAFEALDGPTLGPPYMRVFNYGGWFYAMAMPGQVLRSRDGLTPFATGPNLFTPDQRHSAVLVRGDTLHVFWTRVGDAPERIYASTVDLRPDWQRWRASAPVEVLRPERNWEGADLPVRPSHRSAINTEVNQLRDPAIFEEHGRTYLLYAVKGERGIAIGELTTP